jgi:hypothetical protein
VTFESNTHLKGDLLHSPNFNAIQFMKKFNLFLMALLVMAAVSVGCNNTDPIDDTPEPVGPSIDLVSGTIPGTTVSYVTDVDTVAPGESFTIKLDASNGSSPITIIELLENGNTVDPSRIIWDGDPAQSNPNPVGDAGATTLDWSVTVTTPADVEDVYTYDIILTDSSALEASVTVTISTVVPSPPVTVGTMYLLLNQAGPAGQGGLDVDSNTQTGTTTGNFPIADIRDQGIDQSQPVASNWRQQIAPINGTTLKAAAATLVWDEIQTQEDLAVAYAAAAEISESAKVAEGDIFFVLTTEGKVFGLSVVDIVNTTNDNQDRYEFEAKSN